MAPSIREAAAALARTVAAYSAATHQGIDRPLFWHVDGMRQVRALLAALEADAALATRVPGVGAVDAGRLRDDQWASSWECTPEDGYFQEHAYLGGVTLYVERHGRLAPWTWWLAAKHDAPGCGCGMNEHYADCDGGDWSAQTTPTREAARQAAASAAAQLARDVLAALATKAAP